MHVNDKCMDNQRALVWNYKNKRVNIVQHDYQFILSHE